LNINARHAVTSSRRIEGGSCASRSTSNDKNVVRVLLLLVRVLLNAKHAAVVVGVTLFHVQRVLPHPTRSHTVSMCASWHILKGMHASPRGYLLKSVTSYKKLSKNLSGTNLLELFFLRVF
jgi:hypothetical protein